ncbi:MAG: response regulator [Terracidiphilus sp.]|jgi:CheY-like chemotaxis protein
MKSGRLLVVEDIEKTLAGTIRELEDLVAQIKQVTNVEDAIECLRHEKFDLVLLDWRLPLTLGGPVNDDAGLVVLDHTKLPLGNDNLDIPVIILTAQSSTIDSQALKEHPNCRYVISKLEMDAITRRTSELLNERAHSEA